jgi:hypothetical protein
MIKGFWLALPLLLVIALDGGLTLAGQPADYWQGAFADSNESSQIGEWVLGMGPKVFALAIAAWAGMVLLLSALLPGMLGQLCYAFAGLGHLWGALSWVPSFAHRHLPALGTRLGGYSGRALTSLSNAPGFGYYATLAAILCIALVTVFCFRRAGLLTVAKAKPTQDGESARKKGKD